MLGRNALQYRDRTGTESITGFSMLPATQVGEEVIYSRTLRPGNLVQILMELMIERAEGLTILI